MSINGGPAFPVHGGLDGDDPRNRIIGGGMSLRDYLAANAPITAEFAAYAWGDPGVWARLTQDDTRRPFLAVWSMICYEWADTMLAERAK